MFKKILVPIDGSPNSYRGLRFATGIAEILDAELTLIHVVPEPVPIYTDPGAPAIPAKVYADLLDYAEKLFTKRKKELAAKGVRTKVLLKRGDPATEILKASKGYDLIVIGSRGLGSLKRLFLGSVSNSVVQQSKVPVLVVRPT
jgi:nucleotide-binding universal stress UspA family protein